MIRTGLIFAALFVFALGTPAACQKQSGMTEEGSATRAGGIAIGVIGVKNTSE